MSYQIETIKNDMENLSSRDFYLKHIVRSDNWYFENILQTPLTEIIHAVDDFKAIVSESLNISFNSIMMVGSGKVGYSLSPEKLYKPFNSDENVRKLSDIDIAIISDKLFFEYWALFRKSFKMRYKDTYSYIFNEIYRGYINERNILEVEGCRKKWIEIASQSKKSLHSNLYFKHDISYRIYRSWEDFEEYNLQSINKIKRGVE